MDSLHNYCRLNKSSLFKKKQIVSPSSSSHPCFVCYAYKDKYLSHQTWNGCEEDCASLWSMFYGEEVNQGHILGSAQGHTPWRRPLKTFKGQYYIPWQHKQQVNDLTMKGHSWLEQYFLFQHRIRYLLTYFPSSGWHDVCKINQMNFPCFPKNLPTSQRIPVVILVAVAVSNVRYSKLVFVLLWVILRCYN